MVVFVKPLTKEQKEMIYRIIYQRMGPDDPEPSQVIAQSFGGDEDQYLRVMAELSGISIAGDNIAPGTCL